MQWVKFLQIAFERRRVIYGEVKESSERIADQKNFAHKSPLPENIEYMLTTLFTFFKILFKI